jgi:hypothetical protein
MGLVPEGAGNPFARLDRQSVVGIFKATGSRDPDVLHATKERLLAQPKQLKLLGMISLVIGAFFTVTFILAIAGIPAMLFGWWLRRFSAGNIGAIEAGYADYTASAA